MKDLKIRTSVHCGKPPQGRYIRVSENVHRCWLLEPKKGADEYLVDNSLEELLKGHIRPVHIRLAVDSDGEPYLIPSLVATAEFKLHPWNTSRNMALNAAESRWAKLAANLAKAGYDVFAASGDLGDPKWPDESVEDLVKIAFNGRIISDAAHPMVGLVLGNR